MALKVIFFIHTNYTKNFSMKKNPQIIFPLVLAFFQFVLVSILAAMLLSSCSDPLATELVNENSASNLKVEVIAENPGIYVYTNGYDTTGIVEPVLNKSTFISVTGIRNTNYGKRSTDDYYFTQFSDKNNPVYNKDKKVIGFPGMNMGEVRFNNLVVPLAANKIKFNEREKDKDTTLGLKYSYSSKQLNPSGNKFPYNSSVNFRLDTRPGMGQSGVIQFDIPTPVEIIGKVAMDGSLTRKNLEIDLEWNEQKTGNIEIILGLIDKNSLAFPLFRLTANDLGKLKIPKSIIEKLASEGTKELLVTFIRKKVREETREFFKDNYIVAQSIHNIKIQLQ